MREICRFIVASLICSTSLFAADPVLHRDWVGELQIGDIRHFVQLTIASDREPVTGTIAYPASGGAGILVSTISVGHDHVRFAWTDDAGLMSFDGSLSAGLLAGTVRSGDKQGTLQLAPTVRPTAEAEERLLGYYEMRPGHVLSILKFPLGPVYSDYTTGRVGVLFPPLKRTITTASALLLIELACGWARTTPAPVSPSSM